jgi:hypothetical protein
MDPRLKQIFEWLTERSQAQLPSTMDTAAYQRCASDLLIQFTGEFGTPIAPKLRGMARK